MSSSAEIADRAPAVSPVRAAPSAWAKWVSASAARHSGDGRTASVVASRQRPRSSAWRAGIAASAYAFVSEDRKSTRLNSSHGYISYAVFCLKKKKKKKYRTMIDINQEEDD